MSVFKRLALAVPASLLLAFVATAQPVRGQGATFPSKVYDTWAKAFEKAGGSAVAYKGTGSGDGIKQIAARQVDFGGTDAPLTDNSPSASPSARTVRIDPAAYVGKPVADVRAALRGLGLSSRVATVHNPGGHTTGTVAAVQPTGPVTEGTSVTVDAWGAAPKPAATTGGTKHHGGKPAKGKGKGKH